MRVMQLGHSHYDYLKYFSRRFKRLTSHADLMRAYIDDYYWCSHTLTPALTRMGHETFLCLPTDIVSQRLWCQEQGLVLDESGVQAMRSQIEWFKPDILYISSAAMYHDAVLEGLPWRPPFIVGWHATLTYPHMRFSNYDLILSSHEECLRAAQEQGACHTAIAYPGIPVELANTFPPRKLTDVCFSGYWAVSHLRRNQFLLELAQRLPSLPMDCAYYLGFYDGGPPCPETVQRYNRGAVWGMSMFKAFATSRIVLNGYFSREAAPQNYSPNMRQLEVLGVGSFLLTEQSDNLEAFFTEGKDMATYATTDELVEKAQYYLHHEDEREAIAAHGRATCHRYYNMDVRAKALMDVVERVRHTGNVPALETVRRDLHSARAAYAGDAGGPQGEDARHDLRHILRQAMETARRCLLAGTMDAGLSLLEDLEALAVQGMKDLSLCRALRTAYEGDVARAMCLLRQELDDYPENDTARHCLSQLVLGKSLWA